MSASQRAAVQLPSYLSASSPFGSSLAASKLSEQTGIRVRRQAGKRLIEETIKEHVQRVNSNDCSPVEEESIFVADIGEVYRQCRRWASCLPNVAPFYGISQT